MEWMNETRWLLLIYVEVCVVSIECSEPIRIAYFRVVASGWGFARGKHS